jgi:molybdopterin-binding protein
MKEFSRICGEAASRGTTSRGAWASVLIMKLSARNQIQARVTSITPGEAIANVELDAGGVRLVASITVEAVRDLSLAEGSEVTAVIKASDVILASGA